MSILLLLASLSLVSPKDGATVSLLKDVQREYLAGDAGTRRGQMADAAAREKFVQCGSRPASVTLEWTDDNASDSSAYAIELTCVETGGRDRFEVKGRTKAEIVNLETGRTYEWTLGGEKATFKTAEGPRLMFFPGVANSRDLGGRKGLDGRAMRQGVVYRTAGYNGSSKRAGDSFFDTRFVPGAVRVTKAGQREMVEACGVRTDLDLRNEAECAGMTASPLGTNVVWAHIPIRAYGWLDNDRRAMGQILKLFADERSYPIAFHCSGGRDRAGSLAFVLEGLCGVSEDEMMADWEFSMFETSDLGFAPARIDGLVEMLSRYPGDTLNDRIVSFVKACGVTDEDIAAIRKNLME